jgi:hypothetical protein
MPHHKVLFLSPETWPETHEQWFRQMKIHLEGKGRFNTVKQMHIEYARVAIVDNNRSSIQSGLEKLNLSETSTIHQTLRKG